MHTPSMTSLRYRSAFAFVHGKQETSNCAGTACMLRLICTVGFFVASSLHKKQLIWQHGKCCIVGADYSY